jgi:hypothetical protein
MGDELMNSKQQYAAGQREVLRWLTGYGIRLKRVNDLGMQRDDDGWDHFAWSVWVENWRGTDEPTQYAFPYRMGLAHTRKPTLVDIMAALLSDASCVVDRDFEEFCSDLGYDTDSVRAKVLYDTIIVNNAKLAKLFRTTDLGGLLDKYEPLREEAGL